MLLDTLLSSNRFNTKMIEIVDSTGKVLQWGRNILDLKISDELAKRKIQSCVFVSENNSIKILLAPEEEILKITNGKGKIETIETTLDNVDELYLFNKNLKEFITNNAHYSKIEGTYLIETDKIFEFLDENCKKYFTNF